MVQSQPVLETGKKKELPQIFSFRAIDQILMASNPLSIFASSKSSNSKAGATVHPIKLFHRFQTNQVPFSTVT